jgi:hypothetical protein
VATLHNCRMRTARLLALVALCTSSRPAVAEPLEQPTVKTIFGIERERGGSCSELHAGRPGAPPALNMTDVCHGWVATTCADKVMVRGEGVVEDQAQVLFTGADRTVDLVGLVDAGVRAQWPGHEHLHLQFRAAFCDGTTLVAPFSGSHIEASVSGPAAAMQGALRIIGPNEHVVDVRPGS